MKRFRLRLAGWLVLGLLACLGPTGVRAQAGCAAAAPPPAGPAQARSWVEGTWLTAPDGGAHYVASREGRVLKLSACTLTLLAQTPAAGVPWSHLALSGDGRWLLAASDDGSDLSVFDAGLQPVKQLQARTLDGRLSSGVAQVLDMPQRRSFILGFHTLPELWELSYDPRAEPVFDGMVHDYRMGEAIAQPGFLHPRRTPLSAPVTRLRLAGDCCRVLGRDPRTPAPWDVIHLDVRRKIGQQAVEPE